MARIVITSFGSAGDLHPYLALGIGLRERGHDVRYAVEDAFRPPLESHDFTVHHLTGDGEAMLRPYERQMFGKTTPFASLRVIVDHYLVPTLPAKIDELRAACIEADLLVASSVQIAASFVADLTGTPIVSIALSPTIASAHVQPAPQPFGLPAALQKQVNRLEWAIGNATLRRLADDKVNALRARYNLPPRREWLSVGNLSPRLTAVAISPALLPSPADWPSFVRQTGFLYWDMPADWAEPPELTTFFENAVSTPVVAVSSGSMGLSVQDEFARFFRASIEAVRRVGARALVIGARPGTLPDPLPEHVLCVPYAPFSQVYPRCAAAIHHGGIGTIGQALRAGLPALIAPWGTDQPFNGTLVERAGAGRLLLRRSYTAERAERALRSLLTEKSYRERAQVIARQIAHEDGVAALSTEIERVLGWPLPARGPVATG